MDHEGSDACVDFLNNPRSIYLNMKVISNQPFGSNPWNSLYYSPS